MRVKRYNQRKTLHSRCKNKKVKVLQFKKQYFLWNFGIQILSVYLFLLD